MCLLLVRHPNLETLELRQIDREFSLKILEPKNLNDFLSCTYPPKPVVDRCLDVLETLDADLPFRVVQVYNDPNRIDEITDDNYATRAVTRMPYINYARLVRHFPATDEPIEPGNPYAFHNHGWYYFGHYRYPGLGDNMDASYSRKPDNVETFGYEYRMTIIEEGHYFSNDDNSGFEMDGDILSTILYPEDMKYYYKMVKGKYAWMSNHRYRGSTLANFKIQSLLDRGVYPISRKGNEVLTIDPRVVLECFGRDNDACKQFITLVYEKLFPEMEEYSDSFVAYSEMYDEMYDTVEHTDEHYPDVFLSLVYLGLEMGMTFHVDMDIIDTAIAKMDIRNAMRRRAVDILRERLLSMA